MKILSEYPRPEILCQPQLIKPLHGLNSRTILGEEWWDEMRVKAYKATDFHCAACGVHKSEAEWVRWLEAHECYEVNFDKYTYECTELVALCHYCHNFIHMGRVLALAAKDEIPESRYLAIKAHGNKILRDANLDKKMWIMDLCDGDISKFHPETNGTWDKWRLILEGKQYEPIHSSYQAWLEYYGY